MKIKTDLDKYEHELETLRAIKIEVDSCFEYLVRLIGGQIDSVSKKLTECEYLLEKYEHQKLIEEEMDITLADNARYNEDWKVT
jgi:hypothetical protein